MDTLKTEILVIESQKDTMNNQKDTQRTILNNYGQMNSYSDKALIHKPNYDFAHKKTEKLVTALYMVTDCMEYEDALKGKLRSLGVALLSDIYKLGIVSPSDSRSHISISNTRIKELISFLEIAQTMGFISEMNGIILKNQFSLLMKDLESYGVKDKHFSFTIDSKMFEVERGIGQENNNNFYLKDKRTTFNTMSFINKRSPLQNNIQKINIQNVSNIADKEDRITKILGVIKDRQIFSKEEGVSIKDISLSFPDVSEKTIQRELNSLVSKGKIEKKGTKRWSRYKIVYN